ncbi:MAG: lipopolysaccharide transport periplasmic protein LptA [Gammaproteobacteria bacterium]|nr:MAG: lipopolysaccharide transport periplasmic protein LptA [Gammaproteobacteria bacterium]
MNHDTSRLQCHSAQSQKQPVMADRGRLYVVQLFVLLLAFCMAQGTLALSSNSDAPIHIKADSAELDEKKGVATYNGDVIIKQGSSTLEADTVIIYANDYGLIEINATGSPAHFQQKMADNKATTHAFGNKITYTHATETITLQKNARLEQGQNRFQGDVIKYHTRDRVVTATGSGQKDQPGGRVELIFHPKKTRRPIIGTDDNGSTD